ncbi:MAG: hypothetical protein ACOC6R_01150 [Chloroflexota bacterium]
MVGIENPDYSKPEIERLAFDAIRGAYLDLLHSGREGLEIAPADIRIKKVFIIPNAHLTPDLGQQHERNTQILQGIARNLIDAGFDTELNSYGYPKDIQMMIVGHEQEYILRCI